MGVWTPGEDASNVGVGESEGLGDDCSRCHRKPLVPSGPGQLSRVGEERRGSLAHPFSVAEVIAEPHRLLLQTLLGPSPGQLVVPQPGGRGPVEHQRGRALRVGGSEQRRDETAVPGGEDDGARGARRVQNRLEVSHEGFDRRGVGWREPLRATQAAAVGDDQPAEPGQLVEEAGKGRMLPVEVDVGQVPLKVDEVGRPLAQHLVGEGDVAVPCVSSPGHVHRQIVTRHHGHCNVCRFRPGASVVPAPGRTRGRYESGCLRQVRPARVVAG